MTVGIDNSQGISDGGPDAPDGIPFNRPSIEGNEIEFIRSAVEHGHTSCSTGRYSAARRRPDRGRRSARSDVLLTTSCTAALEMSRAAARPRARRHRRRAVVRLRHHRARVSPRQGARILFCDIERRRRSASIPSHLAELMDDSGARGRADPLRRHRAATSTASPRCSTDWPRAALVEDNAHGLFGRYRGRPLGSFGRFATLSFHETKNFICGEGGALIVNDAADVDRAHVCTTRAPTAGRSSSARSTSTRGRTSARRSGSATCSRRSSTASSSSATTILAKRRAVFDRYHAAAGAARRRARLPAADRAGRPRAGVPHVLRAAARRATRNARARDDARRTACTRRSTTSRCTAPPAANGSRRVRPSAR